MEVLLVLLALYCGFFWGFATFHLLVANALRHVGIKGLAFLIPYLVFAPVIYPVWMLKHRAFCEGVSRRVT